MSLSDEERRIMVEHELNKAHKTMVQHVKKEVIDKFIVDLIPYSSILR